MQFCSGEFIRKIVHKNIGGLITTPFGNYIIISQYGNQIRERKSEQQLCRNLWGHGGSKPLTRILINLLSRLCGILWSCPQALSPEITGAGRFLAGGLITTPLVKPFWVMCCWCRLCNLKPWNMHCRDESFYQFGCQRFADCWTIWNTQWLQANLLNGIILNGFIPQINQ